MVPYSYIEREFAQDQRLYHINTCTKLQLLLGEGSSAFLRRIFELLPCLLVMMIPPRAETPSSSSPTPTVSEEASGVLAPYPGCLSAVLVFQN